MEEILELFLNEHQNIFPIEVCTEEVMADILRSTPVEDDVLVVDWINDGNYVQVLTQNVRKGTELGSEHGVHDTTYHGDDDVIVVDWMINDGQALTQNGSKHGVHDAIHVQDEDVILPAELTDDGGKIKKDDVKANGSTENDCSQSCDESGIITGNVKQVKSGVSKKKCCVLECNSVALALFKFPNVKGMHCTENIKKYGEWIKNIGDRKLLYKSWSTVYNNYYVCEKHFEDDCFSDISRTRIEKGAIPTKFNCASLSDNDIAILLGLDFGLCSNEEEEKNLYALKFEMCMNQLDFSSCDGCNEKVLIRGQEKCVHANKCVDFQASNNMDPGEVPSELKDLSFIEEQLISLIHPVSSVFKLKGLQFGYSGNVINFSQDVSSFAKKLPHKVEELPSVLLLKYQDEKTNAKYFSVRADKVVKALQWLKVNNKFYYDVKICEENVRLLPENDSVYDRLHAGNIGTSVEPSMFKEDVNGQENDTPQHEDIEATSNYLYETGVPSCIPCTTEEQVQSTILDWPARDEQYAY
ncbi:52 kDa repressor of the inhibitor of the protein kinase [Frankliniella fusca]|uniref:52 kDa repressor of the inhibitor of the protein kinase n=1 Tax=Frankliniella fusca TaxID=407009 RepID=A0AAE1HSN5_9NEOP|nr:52 kDa repressor of the inhibitor of the protein kinase [Frankliniella fusca]